VALLSRSGRWVHQFVPYWDAPEWRGLRGRPAIVLGNSPAIGMVDHAHLRRVFTLGVNRIIRDFTPSAVMAVDQRILKDEAGDLIAFDGPLVVYPGTAGSASHQSILSRANGKVSAVLIADATDYKQRAAWVWPRNPGDIFIRGGATPFYAIQMLQVLGANPIGVLGVDFNEAALAAGRRATHHYGSAGGSNGGGQLVLHREVCARGLFFWGAHVGSRLINLSPYDDSPYTLLSRRIGMPRMTTEEFANRYGTNRGVEGTDEIASAGQVCGGRPRVVGFPR